MDTLQTLEGGYARHVVRSSLKGSRSDSTEQVTLVLKPRRSQKPYRTFGNRRQRIVIGCIVGLLAICFVVALKVDQAACDEEEQFRGHCGRRSTDAGASEAIVGGNDSVANEWPWQVRRDSSVLNLNETRLFINDRVPS